MIPVIAIGFVLLAGLLLWLVIGSRGPWWLKLPAILCTCLFTFAVWDALDSFSGWPTAQTPPPRALLLSTTVDEPRAIYLWVVAPSSHGFLEYRSEGAEPRAYRLPYSRQLHAQVDRANKLAQSGQPVELRRMRGDAQGRPTRIVVRRYEFPAGSRPRKKSQPTAVTAQP
jgi:hypothetical protein